MGVLSEKLAGRVAVVTGGAASIGFEIARRLAGDGARIFIADIRGSAAAAETLRAEGVDAQGLDTDVSAETDVARMMARVIEVFGRIDILVNNAAISSSLKQTPFEDLTVDAWRRMLDVNTIGVFLCCRAAAPHMRRQRAGRIINLTSGTAFKGAPFMLHYVASKGAVMSMTRALAKELGRDEITVNAVSPGFTLSSGFDDNPEFVQANRETQRLNRALPRDQYASDIVGSIAFLASDDAAFITGQILAVDGGSVYH